MRGIYDAFNARDVEAAQRFVAEDAELDLRGTAARVGRSEPYRGHDGLRECLRRVAGPGTSSRSMPRTSGRSPAP